MKTIFICIGLTLGSFVGFGQTVAQRLQTSIKQMQADAALQHAIVSLYVADTKTGKLVFEYNGETGLAPASTQKVFTSIAAYELLGASFSYNTIVGYTGAIANGVLQGDLVIQGSGDPTFGSWRYTSTKPAEILNNIYAAIANAGIKRIQGDIILDNSHFSYQPLPGGWIWDDIGNYYGAGTWAINWNENQYDLQLKPGNKEGDAVPVVGTKPVLQNAVLHNHITTGKAGSGDNGYIYLSPYSNSGFTEGTVPAGVNSFTISGAMPDPAAAFGAALSEMLQEKNISQSGIIKTVTANDDAVVTTGTLGKLTSPSLDSIIYWFLQKSINLYGEALAKTFALQQTGLGSTEKGVSIIKQFWQQHGIDSAALHILDGSGLSPQNRVTTHALVEALLFAKSRSWYDGFYKALPLYNNMKMKSGTIGGAKAFAGYQTAKNGAQYTFAIIINNFDGDAAPIVQKMYKILNELK